MLHEIFARRAISTLGAMVTLLFTSLGWALTPSVAWQAPGAIAGPFTSDGSAVFVTSSAGFQLRRASDGAVLSAITLPAASAGYDVKSFSRDGQYVALSKRENGITRIELWRFSSGSLVRTINTDAVRNARGLDISTNGLVASLERFAYGGGGSLRVYRISDGALLYKQGPVVRNSSTRVKFSPSGSYLAFYQNNGFQGTVILNTSNWSSALQLGNNVSWLQWTNDSSALWMYGSPYQRVGVPGGQVLQSAPLNLTNVNISAATSDNRYFLAGQIVSTDPGSPPGNALYFLRASDGAAQVTYTFSTTIVSAGSLSPTGTLFTYAICPTDTASCTAYVARTPAL